MGGEGVRLDIMISSHTHTHTHTHTHLHSTYNFVTLYACEYACILWHLYMYATLYNFVPLKMAMIDRPFILSTGLSCRILR